MESMLFSMLKIGHDSFVVWEYTKVRCEYIGRRLWYGKNAPTGRNLSTF